MLVSDAQLEVPEYLHDDNFILIDVQLVIEGVEVITDPEHGVELSEAGLHVGAEQGDEAGAGQEAELPRPRARAHQALLPPGAGV